MWRILAALFLSILFVLQFHRAATQSITVDEARVYIDFIRPDPPVLLNTYEAAHHVLQTYLSWFFSRRWGGSELVLRIPALLGCIGWFAFAYRFSAHVLGRGALFFGGVLVLACHPLLLDHLTLARGYGLAAALFGWAVYCSVRFVESRSRNFLTAAGVFSALCVSSNLTFLFPICAVALLVCRASFSSDGASAPFLRRASARLPTLINDYLGPAVILGGLILILPLTHIDPRDHYYFGAASWGDIIASLIKTAFDRRWTPPLATIFGYLTLLALSMLAAAGAWFARPSRQNIAATRIASFALILALAATALAHVALNMRLPLDRTALWLITLLTIAAVAGCAALVKGYPQSTPALTSVFVLLAAAYLIQYDTHYVLEWRYTKATKHFMSLISAREAGRGRSYTISGDPEYKFPADYYRIRWKLANMAEMKFGGPIPTADYYLLHGITPAEAEARFGVKLVEEDRECVCLLAAR